MSTQIFVNLPVQDLDAAKAFYTALGYTVNEQFTDENASSIVLSDTIYVMLLTAEFAQRFTNKAIADEIDRVARASGHIVVACSALKRSYRNILIHGRNDVAFIYLDGTHELIAERLGQRKGHFMPPGLLDSQFKTLEIPTTEENAIAVSIDAPVAAIVDDIVTKLDVRRKLGNTGS